MNIQEKRELVKKIETLAKTRPLEEACKAYGIDKKRLYLIRYQVNKASKPKIKVFPALKKLKKSEIKSDGKALIILTDFSNIKHLLQ